MVRWTRDEYIGLMTFAESSRPMFVELFGPLVGLEDEWREQGASEDELNMTAFCWDYVPRVDAGGVTGRRGGLTPQVLEETADHIITKDELGRTMLMFKKTATLPLPQDYPVKDWESWEKVKPLFTFNEDRIDWEQVEKAKALQQEGHLVVAGVPGGFDFPRQLMGEEYTCLAYYDQPDLMRDMLDTAKDTAIKVLERITEKLVIDNLHIHEDMAGKSGCLIGPNTIQEFLKPYYGAVWDLVSQRGTKLFSQDSDGNMNAVMDAFLECGVNVMYPMEPAASMDIVASRKKYGNNLAFKGGIDKHVLREDKEAIRKELEYKLQPLTAETGTVFGLDHRIPNGTPLANYRYYVHTAREILGLPPVSEDSKGWERMAF